ncbi:MAG: pentapeptide repeat-containing protein [Anaerolineae bacterium]|nr:pentapeptide repeat-containing protein [Anaerolineae bacterium]
MIDLLSGESAAYEDQAFEGLDLTREEVRAKEFAGCTFVDCSFLETAFTGCRFVDCEFVRCDLSLCRVEDCSFTAVKFIDSQVIGVNWTEASWPAVGLFHAIGFERCALSHSTFIGLGLRRVEMVDCLAHNADFAEADLSQANCTGTDFEGSRFLHTDLTEADFTRATNYAIAPNLNVLRKTRFALPEAMALLYGLDIILAE